MNQPTRSERNQTNSPDTLYLPDPLYPPDRWKRRSVEGARRSLVCPLAGVVFGLFLLLLAESAAAGNRVIPTDVTVKADSNNEVTEITMTLKDGEIVGGDPLAENSKVRLCFQDSDGDPIGEEIVVTVGRGGSLVITQDQIPEDARSFDNQVVIKSDIHARSQEVIWYDSAGWFSPAVAAIKLDPIGLPTPGGVQSWFVWDVNGAPFPDTPIEGDRSLLMDDDVFGARSLILEESNWDLEYASVATIDDFFEIRITGDDSFMRLSDGTYIAFPDDMLFGTIEMAVGAISGILNFDAIGVVGNWLYEEDTDHTGGSVSPTGASFSMVAISTIPEPTTITLAAFALLGIGCRRRHRA